VKVRITRPAEADLKGTFNYIYDDNPRAAAAVLNTLLAAIQKLNRFAMRGRPGRLPDTREYVVARTGHIIIYEVGEDEVIVLRVRHGRQEPLT
jgi:toxin ParE1/3/4